MTPIKYHIPGHLGIIMDGNGRWARSRGLNVVKGHRRGAGRIADIIDSASEMGINYISFYAFSTENWMRPKEEVDALMNLMLFSFKKEIKDFNSKNYIAKFAGRRENFSKKILKAMEYCEDLTRGNTGITVVLCIDYGGRQEIADAVNKIIEAGDTEEVTPQKITDNLYLPGIPDIDLLIRTSGEERVSNFMLWQLAYSELYFTDVLWPDFNPEELNKAVNSYSIRQRRFGGRI
ncbi:MAG: polyprenyl diphosphate synthase [Elusimicrobiota bacterium]|nr:polyprenyl diphosphate synthase [Elusimicrobiota bacterium]